MDKDTGDKNNLKDTRPMNPESIEGKQKDDT